MIWVWLCILVCETNRHLKTLQKHGVLGSAPAWGVWGGGGGGASHLKKYNCFCISFQLPHIHSRHILNALGNRHLVINVEDYFFGGFFFPKLWIWNTGLDVKLTDAMKVALHHMELPAKSYYIKNIFFTFAYIFLMCSVFFQLSGHSIFLQLTNSLL